MNWSDLYVISETPERHFKMKPCLRILFFLDGDLHNVGPGLLRIFERAWSLLGDGCHFHFKPFRARYDSGGYLKLAKNTRSTTAFVHEYLSGKAGTDEWGIHFETSACPYGVSDRALQMLHINQEGRGYISLILPTDHFGSDVGSLAALADSFADEVPFYSGYVGYALNVAFGQEALRRYPGTPVERLAKAYSGLDCRQPEDVAEIEAAKGSWQSEVGPISNIGWITYLGKNSSEPAKFQNNADIIVRPCRHGCGYQAGKQPALLPMNEFSQWAPYRTLANAFLQKDPNRRVETLDFAGGQQSTTGWLRRFLSKE
jgi:hypothetical protein